MTFYFSWTDWLLPLFTIIVVLILIAVALTVIGHFIEPFKSCEKQNWKGTVITKKGIEYSCPQLLTANMSSEVRE